MKLGNFYAYFECGQLFRLGNSKPKIAQSKEEKSEVFETNGGGPESVMYGIIPYKISVIKNYREPIRVFRDVLTDLANEVRENLLRQGIKHALHYLIWKNLGRGRTIMVDPKELDSHGSVKSLETHRSIIIWEMAVVNSYKSN